MIFTLIPPDHVSKIWLKVLPHVRSLVEESDGRVSEMSIYQETLRGEQLLWLAMEPDGSEVHGFITTKLTQYAKIKMAALEYCAGNDANEWFLPLMEIIEKWAKQYGCDGIEMICGRRGWTRKFKQAGFKDKFTWAEKRFHKDAPNGES